MLACSLAACSRPEPAPEPVRSVKLLEVGVGAVDAQLEYAGEVRARIESRLGFRVAGKLVSRQVELGQQVTAGQLLAQLDAQDYRLAAEASRAQVTAATTQRDLAAADLQRYRTLRAQNFISGAELERREATLKSAQASLDQARAQAAGQSLQADYTRLIADVAGVVTSIDAEPGQVVAAGTPVVRIAQDGERDVVFSVPEDKVARMRPGQAVAVRTWAGDQRYAGRVREVAASADPVTRTYLVKVALERTPGQALPALGATVHARPEGLGAASQPVIKLPTTALQQHGGGSAVWIFDADSSSVRLQPVTMGSADGNEVVITQGLAPGMRVVATGGHVLSPGQKVTVYQGVGETARPADAAPQPIPATR
ncbi:efflux RND transporter periplasmic adaptor subunit [Comamonas endophytica]|uniref:Efflux RND transporter periplasmic adaptor subunit n=2 Tax=Comamonas endophytica TaxID=2949090 RepID=A0ABY6G838_9BURK|nr:efflux RND transporter periplasmic adaptor subunit [Acidovorax sp. 5MLIR]UYG51185.1 efflux RND transporter periplasmic adaptor subunit [Acidovorax sp. 5MLIR]